MTDFITNGSAALPDVKADLRPSTGAITEWAAEDANLVRDALLDLRSSALGVQTGFVNPNVAMVTASGGATALALQDQFGVLGANVLAFGADSSGTNSSATAFQNAASYAGYRGRVVIPKGTYKIDSTVTIPMGSFGSFTLMLEPGAVINYTGSTYAFNAATSGTAYANVNIVGAGEIVGTSSGQAGIRFYAFNKGSIQGVRVRGFTNGDGILIDGANTIDMIGVEVSNNKNGIHLRGIVDGATYQANSCRVIGGHVSNNSQWGIYDDATGAGGAGLDNYYATTFDPNGANAAGTGNIFIQGGSGHTVSSYLEYGVSQYGPYNIVIGDGTHHPVGTKVIGSTLLSVSSTASIYDNGTGTVILGNHEGGSPTNFVYGGAASVGRFIGKNTATGVPTFFGGTDNGDTIDLGNNAGLMGSMSVTAGRGMAFSAVTGNGIPFKIRLYGNGGGRIADFYNDTDRAASVAADGKIMPGIGSGYGQSNGIYMGSGVPNDSWGIDGDFYFRVDTWSIANQRVYIKGTTWHGVL